MKLQNYVVGGGLKRPNGDEAQVGDTVRLYLDTVANPDFPETILGEIDHPITKVNCGSDRAYVIEYTEDFTIRVCDVLDSEVVDDLSLLIERTKTSTAFFDDFSRPDTEDSNIGPASSGQEYNITGTGASSARIVKGGLELVGANQNITYFRPQIDFVPYEVGFRFSLEHNPDAVDQSYVFALVIAGSNDVLRPLIHFLVDGNNASLAKWTEDTEIAITRRIFETPLVAGTEDKKGEEYVFKARFHTDTEQITLFYPDGFSETVDFPELNEYLTKYPIWEIGEVETSVLSCRFEAIWAIPKEEVRPDWGNSARAESAKWQKRPAIFGSDDKIALAFLPQTNIYDVNMAADAWENTLVGANSAYQGGSAITTRAGDGGNTSSLMRNNPNGNSTFQPISGRSITEIHWDIPTRFDITFAINNTTTTAIHRLLLGSPFDETTVNDLANSGIGIKIENLSLKIQTHNGTTLTNSVSLATLVINRIYRLIIETNGAGRIVAYLDGEEVLSANTAPSADSASNQTGIHQSSASGVDTAYAIFTTSRIQITEL